MLASARDLLATLGALDAHGLITAHGREMACLAIHPRLAHMLLKSRELDSTSLGASLAALLSERDVLRSARDGDIRSRIDLIEGETTPPGTDRATLQRARRMSHDLSRQLGRGGRQRGHADAGLLLAFAYPDRIGRRRPGTDARYMLANGRGAHFAQVQSVGREEFIVAVDLDDRDRDARILLAAPLDRADIENHLGYLLTRNESVAWDSRDRAVVAQSVLRLGALTLDEKPLRNVSSDAVQSAMLTGIRELGLAALPWSPQVRGLQARIEFARNLQKQGAAAWPAVDDAQLAMSLESWLAPWLEGISRQEHLTRIDLGDALKSLLSWEQQTELERLAPTHLEVPTGSRIPIDYLDASAPAVSVRLQEVFGLHCTPRIGGGQSPITFKLLSPAGRPVQVTRDLASFWRGAYAEVRKDLRGRYPRHYWPENPLNAEPVRGVRRKP